MHVTSNLDDWGDMDKVEIEIRGHDDHDGRYTIAVYDDGVSTCESMEGELSVGEMASIVNAVSAEMDAEHVEVALGLLAEMQDAETDDDSESDAAQDESEWAADVEEASVAGTTFRHGDRLVGDGREFAVKIYDGQLKLQDGPTRPRAADAEWVESLFDSGYEIEREA